MNTVKNIRFKRYKAFSNDQYAEINDISCINVIIGKNNCGKTSLLEVVEKVFDNECMILTGGPGTGKTI